MGLPGSGKTTQALKLTEKHKLCMVKTGSILRELSSKDDALGREISKAMLSGDLVDNEVVAKLVKKQVEHLDCEGGFVMDGYPRSIEQLEYFDPEYEIVFYLHVSDKTVHERLKKRGRVDDTPELIEHRLRVQKGENKFLLDYFKKIGILVDIDGEMSEERVFEQIEEHII